MRFASTKRAELHDFLGSILDRIELDPEAATLQVCYRIPLRVNVASHVSDHKATESLRHDGQNRRSFTAAASAATA
jgi:hypothetical protein